MNIKVYDIETLTCHFSITVSNPDFTDVKSFVIDQYDNDLFSMVKYLLDSKIDYLVGFNNINFDWQVMQDILENYNDWMDLSPVEIAKTIKSYSQDAIERQNYSLFPKHREWDFIIPQIDLYKLHHFDNKSKRTSLFTF